MGQMQDGTRKEIPRKITQLLPLPSIADTARWTGIAVPALENLVRLLKMPGNHS